MDNNTALTPLLFSERELMVALGPFNNLATLILHYLQETNRLTASFLTEWNAALATPTKFASQEFLKELATAYPVYTAVIGYSFALGIGMLAFGLLWCFCRVCCGRCGAHLKHGRDAKHSKAARTCCGTIMLVCLLVILMGCAMASMSVLLMSKQISHSNKEGDAEQSKNNPNFNAQVWLNITRVKAQPVSQYADGAAVLQAQRKVKREFHIYHQLHGAFVQSVFELFTISNQFQTLVRSNFLVDLFIESAITNLIEAAKRSLGFGDLSGEASQWSDRESSFCRSLLTNIDALAVSIDAKNIASELKGKCTTNQCSQVTGRYENDLAAVSSFMQQLSPFYSRLQHVFGLLESNFTSNALSSSLERHATILVETEKQKASVMQRETVPLLEVTDKLNYFFNTSYFLVSSPNSRSAFDYVQRYGPYGILGLLGTFAFLALFLMLGISCGACGARDTAFSKGGLCRRTRGACIMFLGINLLFLLAIVFASAFLVVFLSGAVSQTELCQLLDLKRHSNTSVNSTNLVEKTLNYFLSPMFISLNLNFDLGTFASRCAPEDGLIAALLDTKAEEFLKNVLAKYQTNLAGLVNTATNDWLALLAAPAVRYDEYFSNSLIAAANCSDHAAALRNSTIFIDNINSTILAEFADTADKKKVQSFATKILQLNGNLLLISQELGTNAYPNNRTSANELLFRMGEYMNRTQNSEVGSLIQTVATGYKNYVKHLAIPCAPLYNAASIVNETFCHDLLKHWHVIWLGLAFVALVYVPTVVAALRLEILYRRVLPFVALPKDTNGEGDEWTPNELPESRPVAGAVTLIHLPRNQTDNAIKANESVFPTAPTQSDGKRMQSTRWSCAATQTDFPGFFNPNWSPRLTQPSVRRADIPNFYQSNGESNYGYYPWN